MGVIITKSIRNIAIAKGIDLDSIVWIVENRKGFSVGADTVGHRGRNMEVQVKRDGATIVVVGIRHFPRVSEPMRLHTRQGARYAKRFHQVYGTYDLAAA